MLLRGSATAILVAICFATLSCGYVYGPVKEAEALVSAKDAITSKWADIAKNNATEAGMAEVKKLWNEKKADLIAKRDAVKNASPGMNTDWQAIINRSESRDTEVLNAIEFQFGAFNVNSTSDKTEALKNEFKAIRKEYEAAIKR